MGARRHGQEGALALPWKMYKSRFASFTTLWFAQKVPKSVLQKTRFTGSKYTQIATAAGDLPQTALHWGSLAYPRPLAVLKKFASQQRKKAKWIGKEGRRGVEWRDRGRDGEEREEVDFTPSCKNSCGRPWRRPLAGRRTATDLGYDRTLYIRSVHAIGIIQASIMGRELWMLRCWSTGSTMGPHFVRSARNHLCTSCEI